jgi:hypothetical protein
MHALNPPRTDAHPERPVALAAPVALFAPLAQAGRLSRRPGRAV